MLNLDFADFCKNCHDMMSALNMCGTFAYQSGTSIVPDDLVKQEIIRLSQSIESSAYPCVYFCNLYGHSFHVTNTKMRNFLCNDSLANVAARYMETRAPVNEAGKEAGATSYHAKEIGTHAHFQSSPFKKMIESMLNCDAERKEEIIRTFMGNSLFKSDRALKSYWSNVPPVPSFQTTFTYDKVPILEYNSLMPMQTTLLVDLSRSVNGETFLHKIYFTDIKPRLVAPLSEATVVQGANGRETSNILSNTNATQRNKKTIMRNHLAEDRFPLAPTHQSQASKPNSNRLPRVTPPPEISKVSLSAISHSETKEACGTNKELGSSFLGHLSPSSVPSTAPQ